VLLETVLCVSLSSGVSIVPPVVVVWASDRAAKGPARLEAESP